MQNLGRRNSIAVEGQENIDAVKGQTLFLGQDAFLDQGPF